MTNLGIALALIGYIWIVVLAFQRSLLWGIGALLLPIVNLAYALLNFGEAKRPFLLWVVGMVLMVVGS